VVVILLENVNNNNNNNFARHVAGPDISSKLSSAGLLVSVNRLCLNAGHCLSRPTKPVARVPTVKQ